MTTPKPSWTLKGQVLIACNCDYGCPCNFNGRPTHGKCEGGWTWHVEQGSFDGVSLDGLNFSVFVNWPGAIHEGLIVKKADLGCSTVFRVREGIAMEHPGRHTAIGPFEYAFP